MIFVYVCSTWSIVENKTRFKTWITRNDVNGLSLFQLPYLITLMAYLCSQRHLMSKSSILCLIGRSTGYCAKYGLNMWFSLIEYIPKYLFDVKHSWTNNTFWDVNNKKWPKWCKFVSPILCNNTYGLPVLTKDTKCPNQVF
jgi:hypothetical protein